jgi:hypothetical protein
MVMFHNGPISIQSICGTLHARSGALEPAQRRAGPDRISYFDNERHILTTFGHKFFNPWLVNFASMAIFAIGLASKIREAENSG